MLYIQWPYMHGGASKYFTGFGSARVAFQLAFPTTLLTMYIYTWVCNQTRKSVCRESVRASITVPRDNLTLYIYIYIIHIHRVHTYI